MTQKTEDRGLADPDLHFRQFGLQFGQRNVRLLCHPLAHPPLVRRKRMALVTAELCRKDAASFTLQPQEANDCTEANVTCWPPPQCEA